MKKMNQSELDKLKTRGQKMIDEITRIYNDQSEDFDFDNFNDVLLTQMNGATESLNEAIHFLGEGSESYMKLDDPISDVLDAMVYCQAIEKVMIAYQNIPKMIYG